MLSNIVSVSIAIVLGIAAWFATNFVGQPIVTLRDKRNAALEAANRYWAVSPLASDETQSAALRALNDAANALEAARLSGSIGVRAWCRLCKYDLHRAARALRGLVEPLRGPVTFPDEARKVTRNAIFLALNATGVLSAGDIIATEIAIEQAKAGWPEE